MTTGTELPNNETLKRHFAQGALSEANAVSPTDAAPFVMPYLRIENGQPVPIDDKGNPLTRYGRPMTMLELLDWLSYYKKFRYRRE